MSPLERLRWAIAPVERRSMAIMYGGVAIFVALGGLAMLLEPPHALFGPIGLLMLAAWLAAGCGMVGYFRWFFRAEVDEQKRR
jgi:hypothetical protein